MDPVTIGAVLLAIISGASEGLGDRLWEGVVALVRRPFPRRAQAGGSADAPADGASGEMELAALEHDPAGEQRAVALADVLLARADADDGFRQALEAWWGQASTIRSGSGNVTNRISGGSQQGPVLQGRDFTHVTFGAAQVAQPPVPPS